MITKSVGGHVRIKVNIYPGCLSSTSNINKSASSIYQLLLQNKV